MGRGIRPIRSLGEDGQRAALELGEAMGLMTDKLRAHYQEYYNEEGKLVIPDGKRPVTGMVKVDLGDGAIGVVTSFEEANYYNSEFNV